MRQVTPPLEVGTRPLPCRSASSSNLRASQPLHWADLWWSVGHAVFAVSAHRSDAGSALWSLHEPEGRCHSSPNSMQRADELPAESSPPFPGSHGCVSFDGRGLAGRAFLRGLACGDGSR